MTPKIYLDLDETVCLWFDAMKPRLGLPEDFLWPLGEPLLEKALGVPDKVIRDAMAPLEFWTNLKPTHYAFNLFNLAESLVGPENVFILTKPDPKTPMAGAGKMIWVDRHFPDYARRLIMTAAK